MTQWKDKYAYIFLLQIYYNVVITMITRPNPNETIPEEDYNG